MGGNKFSLLCLKFQESEAVLLLSHHIISIHFSTVAGVWGGGEEAQGRIGSVKKVERRWRRWRRERRWRRWAFPFLFLIFSHFLLKERRVWDESRSPIVSKEYIERKYSKK